MTAAGHNRNEPQSAEQDRSSEPPPRYSAQCRAGIRTRLSPSILLARGSRWAWALAATFSHRLLNTMRALKHIAGVLLTTVGVMFVLGAIFHLFNPEPEVPLWGVGVVIVFLGLLPLGAAFALLRRTLTAPSRPCPHCGGTERQPAGVLRRSHNPWIFHFGGWLFASLWGTSREQQVRCTKCDTLYLTDTRGTRIAGVLLWVLVLLVLFGLIVQQFEGRL